MASTCTTALSAGAAAVMGVVVAVACLVLAGGPSAGVAAEARTPKSLVQPTSEPTPQPEPERARPGTRGPEALLVGPDLPVRGGGAVPMPRVRPQVPGPVDIPRLQRPDPGPVPMPRRGGGDDTLLVLPSPAGR